MTNTNIVEMAEHLGRNARSEASLLSAIVAVIKVGMESPQPTVAAAAHDVGPAFLRLVSKQINRRTVRPSSKQISGKDGAK